MMLPSSLSRLVDHEIDCIPIHIQRGTEYNGGA
jgi:hypothetical protein